MRELKFQCEIINQIARNQIRDCNLIFYKFDERDLYYIRIQELPNVHGEYIITNGDIMGYSRLNTFLHFDGSGAELMWNLKTKFQHEMICDKICFPESELDKIIEWIESVDIINKLMGE